MPDITPKKLFRHIYQGLPMFYLTSRFFSRAKLSILGNFQLHQSKSSNFDHPKTCKINKTLDMAEKKIIKLENAPCHNFKCAFSTAMTFHSIHVEFYMTKISFLTAFIAVCVRALKTPCLLPRGAIFNRFCAVFM